MGRGKIVLIGCATVVVAIFAFVAWYRFHYSMRPAREFEVNDPSAESKVLIATQGSAFKDAIVSGILAHLRQQPVYVKVVDVSALPGVNEADWKAIVVIHTWEMRKPQPDAKKFIETAHNVRKVIVMSTSGEGTFKMDGVDAISSASELADVPARVAEIDARLDALLDIHDGR